MCFTLYRRQLDNTVSAEAVFTEKGKFNERTDVPLGWVNFQFIDHKDQLRQGLCSFKLWLGKPNPIGTSVENVAVKDKERATTLHVEFQMHRTAVYFPPPPKIDPADALRTSDGADAPKQKILRLQIEEIMKKGTHNCDSLNHNVVLTPVAPTFRSADGPRGGRATTAVGLSRVLCPVPFAPSSIPPIRQVER
jgi:hypothetical protein